jgi:SAM-dependent methyltransferase
MTADLDTPADFSSRDYWEARYRAGKTSGSGSRGRLAKYKATEINRLVAEYDVGSVIDFGCGDGFQIGLLDVPQYTGLDVSPAALELCRTRFADREGWRFLPAADRAAWAGRYDMAMSLDVIFHLVETEVFEAYMHDLFGHATRLVLIYSSDVDHDAPGRHVLHRNVSRWTEENLPQWRQTRAIPNPFGRAIDQPHDRRTSVARFMVYEPAARA